MHEKISFFILNHSGAPMRRVTVTKAFLRFLFVLVIVGGTVFGYGIYDYLHIKEHLITNRMLQGEIYFQKGEILAQRRQISTFAEEINRLKAKLVDLSEFEKKIRVIANIEATEAQDGLLGIGGPLPEDLDTRIPLQEKHESLLREMHEQTHLLKAAVAGQEQQFESLASYLQGQVNLLAATPAIRPNNGWVSCRFGYRKSPFTGLREFHKGIDIANRRGTPIVATADGTVTFAGKKGLLGKTIIIDHGHGMVTRYGHSQKLLKKRGDKVKRGETIALLGNTGRTTGSHVHYEVLLNGVPVNPKKYILN